MTQFLEYAGLALGYFLQAIICALFFATVLFGFLMGRDNPNTASFIVFCQPKTFLSPRGQWYRQAAIWSFGLLVVVAVVGAGIGQLLGLHEYGVPSTQYSSPEV